MPSVRLEPAKVPAAHVFREPVIQDSVRMTGIHALKPIVMPVEPVANVPEIGEHPATTTMPVPREIGAPAVAAPAELPLLVLMETAAQPILVVQPAVAFTARFPSASTAMDAAPHLAPSAMTMIVPPDAGIEL